jgi:prepilin peptidase CpaA
MTDLAQLANPAHLAQLKPAALNGVLLFALGWAVVTDLRSRRISNRLTYPAAALGLAIHFASGGWGGLTTSAVGLLLGLGLLLLPFFLGAMGGGDVKLLAAIGALQGPQFVLLTAVYAGLAGGVLALGYLIRQRGLTEALRYATGGWIGGVRPDAPKAGAIPYGPAIASGAAIVLLRTALGVV